MTSIWGEDDNIKTAEFNKAVKAIENKYTDLFAERVNLITGKAPDNLQSQFMTTFDGHQRTCGFRKDTYVPATVQNEVYEAFNSIFSSK